MGIAVPDDCSRVIEAAEFLGVLVMGEGDFSCQTVYKQRMVVSFS